MADTPKPDPRPSTGTVITIITEIGLNLKQLLSAENTLSPQFLKATYNYGIAVIAENQRMNKKALKGEKS